MPNLDDLAQENEETCPKDGSEVDQQSESLIMALKRGFQCQLNLLSQSEVNTYESVNMYAGL